MGTERERTEQAKHVIVALLGAADATRRYLGRAVAPYDLTLQQYNVLRILRGARPDPLPTMSVAERMLEKTPGVTRFLDALEARRLVGRERQQDDRRTVMAWITKAGLELLAAMDDEIDRVDRSLIEGMSSSVAQRLARSLEAIEKNTQ